MSDLLVRLQWQGQVNLILINKSDRCQQAGEPLKPLLTKSELAELDGYYDEGWTPEDYSAMIMRKDARAQAKYSDANGDNAPRSDHDTLRDAGRIR